MFELSRVRIWECWTLGVYFLKVFELNNFGIWEFVNIDNLSILGNFGIWGFRDLGILGYWEFGNLGVLEYGCFRIFKISTFRILELSRLAIWEFGIVGNLFGGV